MKISRQLTLDDPHWGGLPELPARLKAFEVSIDTMDIEISRYPDRITYQSIAPATTDIRSGGSPKSFGISMWGKRRGASFRLRLSRGWNVHDERYHTLQIEADDNVGEIMDAVAELLKLVPDAPTTTPQEPERSAFVAHRFDDIGIEAADRLARFLGLLRFQVVTGRAFAPKSIADKVKERLSAQAMVIAVMTPGDDKTWLIQESSLAAFREKPLIILRDQNAPFVSGLLADLEYVPFTWPHIESTFIPLLEGLRELGYRL